jgi:hypothetical protein
MASEIAGREVRLEPAARPPTVARRMSGVAGVIFTLAIVMGIPEAQRRLSLFVQSAGSPSSTIFASLVAVGLFLLLYGVPAIVLIHGGTRLRGLALLGPLATLVSFAVTTMARAEAGAPRPSGVEVAELVAFIAALVVLLTGRPSRARLRAGLAVGGLWLVLGLLRAIGPL